MVLLTDLPRPHIQREDGEQGCGIQTVIVHGAELSGAGRGELNNIEFQIVDTNHNIRISTF